MTAIVGFMNKRGVAVAADSAVTLGNTHKVVNSGNKIFTLSKYAPVGVTTYGNASFMDTPWEIIFKLFRKHIGRKKFATLEDYISNFIEFLHVENFLLEEIFQKQTLLQRAIIFYNISVDNSKRQKGYISESASTFLSKELARCKRVNSSVKAPKFSEMQTYSYKQFTTYFQEIFLENIAVMPLLSTVDIQTAFLQSFYQYLLVHVASDSDSGLVFFGYGEKELYPSMINFVVADSFDNRLRYIRLEGNSGAVISRGSTAWVIPYAQIDVAQTIIRGINPSFLDILGGSLVKVLDGYRHTLISMIPPTQENDNVIKTLSSINHEEVAKQFVMNSTGEFKRSYTDPLINTVARLSKEDMATLAESLVELTSLVRRMSPKEETVGGPIDVAIVSKGDGFIWLKRKHYFDLNLNPNFINTYYDE